MQRGNDPDKFTGTNSDIDSTLSANNSRPKTSTAANTTGAMSDSNATSSYQQQSAPATALQPSIGGAAMPYNSAKIEAAKQHLVDSLNGTHIDNSVDHTNNSKSATRTIPSGATSVATGAAKKLVSHDDETKLATSGNLPSQVAEMPSYAKDIPSSTASTTTLYGSPFPTDHDSSISSTGTGAARDMSSGQSRTTAPLGASSIHPNLHSEQQNLGTVHPTGLSQNATTHSSSTAPMMADSQQLHHQDGNTASGSMKGREVSTAGVMGATSALFPAPPMKDTVTSTTDIPPTAPGQAPASSNLPVGSHDAAAMGATTAAAGAATYNTNKSQQDADLLKTNRAERRPSIADKFKNVFRRRSSDNDNIETGNFRGSNNTLGAPNNDTTLQKRKSSGLNAREMATAAAAAAKIQAATAAGPHSHLVNKNVSELSQQGSTRAPDSPQLTSSGAPKADLHATSGVPATKIDAVPTTTLNQGYHNAKAHEVDTSKTATTASHAHDSKMDTRPLKEKISAPIGGTAIAGTAAAFAGHRASTGKGTINDPIDPAAAVNASTDLNPTHMSSTLPAAGTTLDKTGMNVDTDHSRVGASTTSHPTSPTRPLAEKVKAPIVGAAAAVAGLGNKMKETVSNVTRRRSSTDASKVAATQPATGTASMDTTMPSTTSSSANQTAIPSMAASGTTGPTFESSHAMPAIGATTAAGASMAARDMSNRDMSPRDTFAKDNNNNVHTSSVAPAMTTAYATPSSTSTTAPKSNISAGNLGTASALGAAAAGTAAYATHQPSAPSHTMNTSNNTTNNTTGYNNTSNTNHAVLNTPATASTKMGAEDITVADKIASAIPTSFHGTVPKAGPGEEVVWVKTVTTTDYYDTMNAQDTVGNVVETRQDAVNVNPSGAVEQRGGGRHM
ncbi:hypothetical protein BGZ75_007809 [Mortierella antarctica]|nr:hypothetical protein BGZ75_007809 [Mortierella antarctica]